MTRTSPIARIQNSTLCEEPNSVNTVGVKFFINHCGAPRTYCAKQYFTFQKRARMVSWGSIVRDIRVCRLCLGWANDATHATATGIIIWRAGRIMASAIEWRLKLIIMKQKDTNNEQMLRHVTSNNAGATIAPAYSHNITWKLKYMKCIVSNRKTVPLKIILKIISTNI